MCYPSTCQKHLKQFQEKKCVEIPQEYLDKDETRMLGYQMASTTACVKIGDTCGEELKTNIGSSQSDCLSPILFTTYLFKETEGMRKEAKSQNINEISYVDDQNFHSNNEEIIKIQKGITNVCPKFNLKINPTKTKILQTNNLENTKILGIILNTQSEIKERIRKANVIAIRNQKFLKLKQIKLKN